jgi:HlyD family secretion protein
LPSRNIVFLAIGGVLIALLVAFLLNRPIKPQPPAFEPAANPYARAIFANGIIESDQTSGENINVYPEVSGRVVATMVHEGEVVRAGQPLIAIDDSVQRATTLQQQLQAQAALAQLNELKAEPRRETLTIAIAQLDVARANLDTLARQRDKLQASASLDPRSVSREALDTAIDQAKAAEAAVLVAQRQLELTRAGAWSYDIQNQEAQYAALSHAHEASVALLSKYVLKAPVDGSVLAINAARGGYISTQGVYDSYSQTSQPPVVMATGDGTLNVRCYVDEILIRRLPKGGVMRAQMSIRGASYKVPLQFVRVQPYVTPKIELSNERQEKVDLRVLPVIFSFKTDPNFRLYPGEVVDVYISE